MNMNEQNLIKQAVSRGIGGFIILCVNEYKSKCNVKEKAVFSVTKS